MTEFNIAKTLSGIQPWPVHSHTPTKGNAMSALSRRSLVTSTAALPALAVPAIAVAACAEPDPVFAAIEACLEAERTYAEA
jgi:hypothetical protein